MERQVGLLGVGIEQLEASFENVVESVHPIPDAADHRVLLKHAFVTRFSKRVYEYTMQRGAGWIVDKKVTIHANAGGARGKTTISKFGVSTEGR